MAQTSTAADEFTEFYSVNFRPIAAQLYAYLGDHAEAQDVTQEAFCRAFDRWDRVRQYESAGGWVRQVAWNLATSRLRHLQAAMRHLTRQRPDHGAPPGTDRVDLVRALAALPPNHRLAVVLHHLEQLSTSEIAALRGVAEGTVRSWLSRGRSQLAAHLLDAEEWPAPDVKLPGAGQAVATARRRRVAKRSTVAAVLAVAVLIPLALALLNRDSRPSIIEPTKPPVVPSPQGPVQTRRLTMPGTGSGPMPVVNFRDRSHAWSTTTTCLESGCTVILVRTNDGGLTWSQVPVPDLGPRLRVMVMSMDHNTFVLELEQQQTKAPMGYRLTTDGGVTWTSYTVNDPPIEAFRSFSRYLMVCPNELDVVHPQGECGEVVLVDRHERRVIANQPPWRGGRPYAPAVAGGRIWVVGGDARSTHLVSSGDGGKTWRDKLLPALPGPDAGEVKISPDGSQVWFISRSGLWKLVGIQWRRQLDWVGDAGFWELIDTDLWASVRADGVPPRHLTYFKDGQFTAVEDTGDIMWVSPISDGTLVAHAYDSTYYLGVGTGMDRRWVHLTL